MSHSPECPCGRPRAGCEYHDPSMQPLETRGATTERTSSSAPCASNRPRRTALSLTLGEQLLFRQWAVANPDAWHLDCKGRRGQTLDDVIVEYLNERKGPWAAISVGHAPAPIAGAAQPVNHAALAPAGLRRLGPDDPEVSDDLIYLDAATGGVVGVPQSPAASAPSPGVTIGGLHLQRSDYSTAIVDDKNGRLRLTLPFGSEREVKLSAMFIADRLCTHRPTYVAVDAPALNVRTTQAWFETRHTSLPGPVTFVLRFAP